MIDGCADVVGERVTVEANLRIARGLDYYTGTVLEIFMAGYERLKSVGGGGRYDALASDGRTTYPGVGVSFGVSRTLVPLISHGVLAGSRNVPSAVLVALTDEEARPASDAVATRLRGRGIACEVAAGPGQVRQADPVRRAAGHPLRLVRPGRRQPPGQGHPVRRRRSMPTRAPGPRRRQTSARASS